jgi:hypothetical protein
VYVTKVVTAPGAEVGTLPDRYADYAVCDCDECRAPMSYEPHGDVAESDDWHDIKRAVAAIVAEDDLPF